MQTECRDASLLVIYAEVQLILCKDKQKMKDFSLFNHFYILILS